VSSVRAHANLSRYRELVTTQGLLESREREPKCECLSNEVWRPVDELNVYLRAR